MERREGSSISCTPYLVNNKREFLHINYDFYAFKDKKYAK
jgi:hypothetical protein